MYILQRGGKCYVPYNTEKLYNLAEYTFHIQYAHSQGKLCKSLIKQQSKVIHADVYIGKNAESASLV